MSSSSPLVGPLLQRFLTEHLPRHKHASSQTILSYRDTFRLVLCFLRQQRGIAPTKLRVADLDVDVLLAFLDHLEQQRQNSVRSRNTRLAALRSFFRWVALCEPDCVGHATRVLTNGASLYLKKINDLAGEAISRCSKNPRKLCEKRFFLCSPVSVSP